MRVVGIDPGLNRTGWAVVEDGVVVAAKTLRPSGANRLADLYALCWRERVGLGDAEAVYAVETQWSGRFVSGLLATAQARGAALSSLYRSSRVIDVSPAQAKKALVGSGRASKADVMAAALKMYPHVATQDEADAIAIALAGLVVLKGEGAVR